MRPAWVDVDLDAIRHNVGLLAEQAAPAVLCAVVKANAYGHGALPVAKAALEAGARWLAVALVDEGAQLRAGGIEAPVLILSEPAAEEMDGVVAHRLVPTVYSHTGIEAMSRSARRADGGPLPVHLKIDTGMHRIGAPPDEALPMALAIRAAPELMLEGLCTHFAVADQPDCDFTATQRGRFEAVRAELRSHGIDPPLVHAANSGAALAHPSARYAMVRTGIAMYGLAPSPALSTHCAELRPALSLRARVSDVRRIPAGDGVSYGLRRRFEHPTTIATVPLGYADGVARRLFETGGALLIGGRRRPLAGVVTMDQCMVAFDSSAVGQGEEVRRGDEVVLIGTQGAERVGAEEWAQLLGTISYEVVCAISSRVPRRYS